MSPKTTGKSSTGWKPPRDRRELVIAVLASLAVVVITAALIWFLRPNRDSGSTVTDTVATTAPAGAATTTAPVTSTPVTSTPATSTPVTTAPATTSSTP